MNLPLLTMIHQLPAAHYPSPIPTHSHLCQVGCQHRRVKALTIDRASVKWEGQFYTFELLNSSPTVIFINSYWLFQYKNIIIFSQDTPLCHFSYNFASYCFLGKLLVENETWCQVRSLFSMSTVRIFSVATLPAPCAKATEILMLVAKSGG